MPVPLTYPGVYIEEVPSGVRTITGVATSITAFIGSAIKGPVDKPVRIASFGDFQRLFGGLSRTSTMSHAVQHYFTNGGRDAHIVRVVRTRSDNDQNNASVATATIGGLSLQARNPGTWGNRLTVTVDHDTSDPTDDARFNLTIEEDEEPESNNVLAREIHRNVSTDATSPRFVASVLDERSALAVIVGDVPDNSPDSGSQAFGEGRDGESPTFQEYEGNQDSGTGIFALEGADLFNLLCIPPFTADTDVPESTWTAALTYFEQRQRRAMLLIDPPRAWRSVDAVEDATTGISTFPVNENAALFFPYLKSPDPLNENRLTEFAPSGAVAGVFARIDAQRGVWKAPAGIEATLRGIPELAVQLSDHDNGRLNPLGVNCLRTFPGPGRIIWGSRTRQGADRLASEWKHIPVRRTALFIEESLYRGTQWGGVRTQRRASVGADPP